MSRFVNLSVFGQPSWCLADERGAAEDEAREEHLAGNRKSPSVIVSVGLRSIVIRGLLEGAVRIEAGKAKP